LRCGLDDTLWNIAESADKCIALVKKYRSDANLDGRFVQVLPFDLERAHGLYKALLEPVVAIIKDKHLFIVPSGALTQLPFQVLVTANPVLGIQVESVLGITRCAHRTGRSRGFPARRMVGQEPRADGSTFGFFAQGAAPAGKGKPCESYSD